MRSNSRFIPLIKVVDWLRPRPSPKLAVMGEKKLAPIEQIVAEARADGRPDAGAQV
jgi:hypothetical protein